MEAKIYRCRKKYDLISTTATYRYQLKVNIDNWPIQYHIDNTEIFFLKSIM
jgi:hypothetical protein